MSEFEELLTKVAAVLEKLSIPYIITGGAAIVFWGRPRFTADIDIVVELYDTKIMPLITGLRTALGKEAYIDEKMVRAEQKRSGEFNVIHPQSGLKVDFFVKGNNPFEKKRLERTVVKKIGGQPIRFISPEDLILIKLSWHKDTLSTKHLEDAQSIIAIQGEKLDMQYLKQWAEQQGTSDLLNKILNE